jgi:hypothetical protein
VVGEHHDVEAVTLDGCVRDGFEIRGVGRDAEEAHLSRLLQSIEGLVGARVQEPLDGVAGVDVDKVYPVGAKPPEAAVDGVQVGLHGRAGRQMAVGHAELRRQEELVAASLHGFPETVLAARGRVVGRRVEVVDAAVDRLAHHVGGLASSGR